MITYLKKPSERSNSNKSSQLTKYKSDLTNKTTADSFYKKSSTYILTDSNKQTFETTYENMPTLNSKENEKKNQNNLLDDKITCLDLLNTINEKRKNQLIIPLKEGKIKKGKLNNTVENLKDEIEKISSDVTKVKNSETDLNTSNKKNTTITNMEITLGKEYEKEINLNKNICKEMNENINQLDNETLNSNQICNELNKEVDSKQKKCKELSNKINQLIEDKKEINTLLIIYQTKIKKMKENIYNQNSLENRIKSQLKTIISIIIYKRISFYYFNLNFF